MSRMIWGWRTGDWRKKLELGGGGRGSTLDLRRMSEAGVGAEEASPDTESG